MKIKDSLFLGLILGIVAPSIGILIFYYSNYAAINLMDFFNMAIKEKLLSPLLSLCAVINLAVFYLFIHFENYSSARGVIMATFIYGLAIVILKFFI